MRILVIRGRNLASISGDFEVSLDREPLAGAGLFAITGPTGAGKSTLLDAMCLALFDKIPRLRLASSRSKVLAALEEEELSATDSRGVLRRGTGEGYAEVEFADAHRRRYRSRWTVRRARGRPDGRLQTTEMALWGPDGAPIAGGKKAEVLAEIEARLGLGFEQFRRAALLAQGEFAAFLHADPTERANVLERVTGTEIYARLSMAAHERAVAAQEALRVVRSQMAQVGVLPPAERAEVEALREVLEVRRAEYQEGRDLAQKALDWHLRDEDLANRLEEAIAQRDARQAEIRDHASEADRDRAQERLEPLRPRLEDVDRATREAEVALRAEATHRADAEQTAARRAEAEASLARFQAAFDAAIHRGRELQAALQLARGLDAAQESASRLLQQRTRESADARARLDAAARRVAEERATAANRRSRLVEAEAALLAQAADAPLEHQLDTWIRSIDRLDQVRGEIRELEAGVQAGRAALDRARTAEADAAAAWRRCSEAEAEAQTNLLAAEAARAILPADLPARRASWERRRTLVEAAAPLFRAIQEDRRAMDDAEAQARLDEASATSAAGRIESENAEIPRDEAAMREAHDAWVRLRDALGLADRRDALVDGEPCPLCGSAHHPWARAGAPVAEAVAAQEARVAALRTALERRRERRAEATQALALARQRAQAARRRALEAGGRVEHAEARWSALWAEEPALGPTPGDPASLQVALAAEGEALGREEQGVRAAEAAVAVARARHGEAQVATVRAAAHLRETADQLSKAELAVEGASARLEAARGHAASGEDELARLAGVAVPPDLATWRLDLQRRASAYQASARRVEGLRAELAADNERLAGAAASLDDRRSEAERADEAEKLARNAHDEAVAARASALDGRPTDRVAQEQIDVERQTAADLERARHDARAAHGAHEAAHRARELAGAALSRAHGAQRDAIGALEPELAALGVSQEQARAMLIRPAADLRRALETHRGRVAALREAEVLLEERARQLHAHRAGDLPPPKSLILENIDAIQGRLHQLRVEHAAVEAKLLADDHARATTGALAGQEAERLAEYELWATMDDLIGSKDGRVFKRFAQGLTLDTLLANANRHLAELAPRYRLLRVPGSELDLQVLDRDMGDEVRAVYSLSGGETFLVSLALALGLAALSATDTPVDSLFIDEGFGTLDSETLDAALGVLDALQAGGRQVGVISHVPGLADRVGAQVRVVPSGAGRSTVRVSATKLRST